MAIESSGSSAYINVRYPEGKQYNDVKVNRFETYFLQVSLN